MNDDIRGPLSRALPDDLPAPRIDLDTVERDGERLLRRRRFGLAGSATLGVAVLAAAVLSLPMAFAGGTGNEAADDEKPKTEQQQAYPLPKLDPDKNYDWASPPPEEQIDGGNEATAQLSEAFWKDLAEKYPDLKVPEMEDGIDPENPAYLDPEDYPQAIRSEEILAEVDSDTDWPVEVNTDDFILTDYRKPVYRMGGDSYALLNPDAKYFDSFSLELHPRGGFAEGPESIPGHPGSVPLTPHLVSGCKDEIGSGQGGHNNFGFEYDCDESTGPGGEMIHKIALTVNGGEQKPDFISYRVNTVIVTLGNGNAVVLSDSVDTYVKGHESDDSAYRDKMKPAMSCDDLAEFALRLPAVVVE